MKSLNEIESFATLVGNHFDDYGGSSSDAAVYFARAILEMLPVMNAVDLWFRSGSNPCGEEGCRCTDCQLWSAVGALRARLHGQ